MCVCDSKNFQTRKKWNNSIIDWQKKIDNFQLRTTKFWDFSLLFFWNLTKKNISSQGSIDSIIEKNYRNISRQKWWWWQWLNNNNIIHIIYKLSSKCWKLCLHLRKIIGFIITTIIIIVEFQFSLHFKKFEPNRIFFRFILLFLFL